MSHAFNARVQQLMRDGLSFYHAGLTARRERMNGHGFTPLVRIDCDCGLCRMVRGLAPLGDLQLEAKRLGAERAARRTAWRATHPRR